MTHEQQLGLLGMLQSREKNGTKKAKGRDNFGMGRMECHAFYTSRCLLFLRFFPAPFSWVPIGFQYCKLLADIRESERRALASVPAPHDNNHGAFIDAIS